MRIFDDWGSWPHPTHRSRQTHLPGALLRVEGLESRINPADVFLGFEVDLVGVWGVEFGAGFVIDTDTPLDSGIYITGGQAGGANVGAGFVAGVVLGGDLEGDAGGADINIGPASIVGGVGTDGGVMLGIGYGPGIGLSASLIETRTLSIRTIGNTMWDAFSATGEAIDNAIEGVGDFISVNPPGIGMP